MYSNFNIGDVLIREKGGFFSKHHVIHAGIDPRTGEEVVAENQVGYGVRIITLKKCLSQGKLTRVKRNNLSPYAQELVISRINQLIGKPYDLTNYNCEHFVNHVLYGKIESKQVAMAGLGVAAAVTLALILRA